jgi:hypothetical protein
MSFPLVNCFELSVILLDNPAIRAEDRMWVTGLLCVANRYRLWAAVIANPPRDDCLSVMPKFLTAIACRGDKRIAELRSDDFGIYLCSEFVDIPRGVILVAVCGDSVPSRSPVLS